MKKSLITLFFGGLVIIAKAQSAEDFKSLQINSSPAYTILGVEPENIQRPNSPTDFIGSAQSAVVNGKLQPNFAMETTPYYWGKKKPADITRKYSPLYFITNNNYWENLARSFSLSFATSPSDTFTFGNIPAGTGLGFGFHVQLVQGKVSHNTRDNLLALFRGTRAQLAMGDLETALKTRDIDVKAVLDNFFLVQAQSGVIIPADEEAAIKSLIIQKLGKAYFKMNEVNIIHQAIADIDSTSMKTNNQLTSNKIPLTREGFMLEFSFADAAIAEDSRWDRFSNAKCAFWLTPSYRFNVNKNPKIADFIDVMAVIRMTINSRAVDSSNYLDAGLKMQWIHNNFSLSGESIYRLLTEKPANVDRNYTWRNDVSLSYRISDAVTFKATFGSNFDGNSNHYSDAKKMFAVGGFNFGFSNFLKRN